MTDKKNAINPNKVQLTLDADATPESRNQAIAAAAGARQVKSVKVSEKIVTVKVQKTVLVADIVLVPDVEASAGAAADAN